MSPLLETFANASRRGWFPGAAEAAAPAMELISTTLVSSNTASVTFSSIPSTYKHLQIRAVARMSSYSSMYLRFNGDTGLNYTWHRFRGNGSSTGSDAATTGSDNFAMIGNVTALGYTTDAFGPVIVDVLDYGSTAKYKVLRYVAGLQENNTPWNIIQIGSSAWVNTAAINSITLVGNPDYVAGTRLSLYGIKGA